MNKDNNNAMDIKSYLNTPPLSTAEELCDGMRGPQRALVARSRVSTQAVVLSASCGVRFDMQEGSYDAGDMWPEGDLPPTGSLRVWEGRLVAYGEHMTFDGPVDGGLEYEGDWRAPTPEELQAIVDHCDIFRCTMCDGSGFADKLDWTPPEWCSVGSCVRVRQDSPSDNMRGKVGEVLALGNPECLRVRFDVPPLSGWWFHVSELEVCDDE